MKCMAPRIFRRCDHCGEHQIVCGNRRPYACELPKETIFEAKLEGAAQKMEEGFARSIFQAAC